jgi:hypothetical protein
VNQASARTGWGVGPRRHRLFGLTLLSDFDFESRLGPGRGAADLTFSVLPDTAVEARLDEPLYESPLVDEAGDSLSRLYRLPQCELLRFGEVLDFYLGADRIDCHLRQPGGRQMIEIRLLGAVLAYWLERMGIRALHASAVVVDGRAVAFMATHQGGKTGLAATLVAHGAPLLSDDLMPVEARPGGIVARSGYPQMRMRPDAARHFVDPEQRRAARRRLGKLWVPVGANGFGAFQAGSVPLACVYLPERQDPRSSGRQPRISGVEPRQAVIELLRGSFSPYIVEAVGLQPRRLEDFADLAQTVPVRRLVYPSGFEALPRVRDALLEDLDALEP